MTISTLFTSTLIFAFLVVTLRFRSFVNGFSVSNHVQISGTVSIWLSGWFKFTERVQRGEVPIAGRLFVVFTLAWLALSAYLSQSAGGDIVLQSAASFVFGLVTLIVRCSPTLIRGRGWFARGVSAVHVVAGIVTLTLLM